MEMIGDLMNDALSGAGLCEIDTNPKICDNKMFHCILKKGDNFLKKFSDELSGAPLLSNMLTFANDKLVLPFFCGVTDFCKKECAKDDSKSCPDKDAAKWASDKWEMCEDFKGKRFPAGIVMDFAQTVLDIIAEMLAYSSISSKIRSPSRLPGGRWYQKQVPPSNSSSEAGLTRSSTPSTRR